MENMIKGIYKIKIIAMLTSNKLNHKGYKRWKIQIVAYL
jgi:hypothetical protein